MPFWGNFRKTIKEFVVGPIGAPIASFDDSAAAPGATSHAAAFDADRPKQHRSEDRLGFRVLAGRLAQSIADQSPSAGYVVSIEGIWGCGKTSLINFLVEELATDKAAPPEIVRFEPWIIGDKNGMLSELMNALAVACDRLDASEEGKRRRVGNAASEIGAKFKSYASKLGRATAPIAQIAAAFGVPAASILGTILESTADTADAIDLSVPVEKMKQELVAALAQLDRSIVVIVDDLDRLEPQEALEVLRLIRAVADFPNIIYVLSYDKEILAENIENALEIDDGAAFLKKIVQVSFKVPLPEAFDLRRWFQDECIALHATITGDSVSDDVKDRLLEVCNIEGGLLKTPRDIARVLNAIKLSWPPVADHVDFPDMVWLQLRRVDNEQLYAWIEEYLVEYAAQVDGATISEAERVALASRLRDHIDTGIAASPRSLWRFGQIVPGLKTDFGEELKGVLFDANDNEIVGKAVNLRRLASPQHYRFYFALSGPSGALDDQILIAFLAKAESGADLLPLCKPLIEQTRPQGGTMMSVLLDRLRQLGPDKIVQSAVPSILSALSSCMDVVAQIEGRGSWGRYWAWSSGRMLTKQLLSRVDGDKRASALASMFGSGQAIGWLMCELLRGEAFAHGRGGGQKRGADEWLLSDSELDRAIELLLNRMKTDERRKIIDSPQVLSFTYGWQQLGGQEAVTAWISEESQDDDHFLRLLNAWRSWRSSSDIGTYYPLIRGDVEHFMSFDDAVERLKRIETNAAAPQQRRVNARELLEAVRLAADD